MKIEKISDNQIRCTLNKNDLIDRELKISELAYGTEKAKALFRDMIQQAFYEFGFEVDDIPLMIEAIPVSPDCLVLVITKVEDPEELDTRFSKFSSIGSGKDSDDDEEEGNELYADDLIDCFDSLSGISEQDIIKANGKGFLDAKESEPNKDTPKPKVPSKLSKVFSFNSLNEVIALAGVLVGFYRGVNTLYKDTVRSKYYLVMNKSEHTLDEFNKICNIALEYGEPQRNTYATIFYYDEHYEVIVKDQALQILSVM